MDVKPIIADINVMIIAGEASGDLHGAALAEALKKKSPYIKLFGIAGDNMTEAGVDPVFHIRDMAFLGFTEIIRHLPYIRRVRKKLLNMIAEKRIKTVILIDYPGFNLNFAKFAKRMGVKIIYYISPQVWAWHQSRIKKIRKLVDKILVVFPFEEKIYKENGVNAEFVGHPLADRLSGYKFLSEKELDEKFKLTPGRKKLLIMPGSRKQEIERIFPPVIKAAGVISEKYGLETIVACAKNIEKSVLEKYSGEISYKIVNSNTYDFLRHSYFGIIKSGTSTLEAGYFALPFLVVYKTSSLTYRIGKMLIQVKNIAMANLLLGRTVVEELIQDDVNPETIVARAEIYLTDEDKYNNLKEQLGNIRELLGNPGASERAAGIILEEIEKN